MALELYTYAMLDSLIKSFVKTGKFTAQEIVLTARMCEDWVQFKTNPPRFLPQIFDGHWARPEKKPQAGKIKLVRIICGNDGVYRLIGRQGDSIYATPWIGN